jgi:nucleoside phosphorylase
MAAIQKTHGDYTVAWICALPLEAAAATAMLEKTHPKLLQSAADDNAYTLGEVAGHNIVIACLPSGVYGTTSAATVAAQMRSTFPSVRFGLMVGIGGGVPSTKNDIRLGDIVVSKPTGTLGGVVQYDYGKAVASGVFRQTGMMNQPPQVLLNAIAQLQADEILGHNQSIVGVVSDVLNERVEMERQCSRPLREQDHLYDAAYHHPKNADTCIKCNKEQLINRKTRSSDEPQVHYGLVASGNQVMKDGQMRDRLAKKHGMLCFEMEAAGLMNQLPCLVIRGICDYCDSHKNKEWQGYAAITAAAYTKILLSVVPVNQLPLLPMDPLSVLSLASSIAGLVDIATRSITTLTELQARYTRVGLRFKQLAGQLSTLKAALNKIKHGIETHQTGVWDNEQLVSDLVVSIDCCESVMTVLDDKLIWFDRTQLAGLGVRMKAQSLWEESDIAEYQSMLNNQINALNLLLTVTQWSVLLMYSWAIPGQCGGLKITSILVNLSWNKETSCRAWKVDMFSNWSRMIHLPYYYRETLSHSYLDKVLPSIMSVS